MSKIALLLFLLIPSLIYADVTGVRRVVDMDSNTSPSVNDVTYTVDISDTSRDSAGTGKKATIKQVFKAADITVDGTNVGLGSITPGQKLDVQGTVRATAFQGDGSGLTGVAASASDAVYSAAWDGDTTGIASKNALYDKIETIGASGGGWQDNGTSINLVTSTDNVGLGSTSTGNKLTVLGGVGIGTVAGDNYLGTSAGNGGFIMGGNFGVGTHLPSSKVEVMGGGIRGELVNKGWEVILTPKTVNTVSSTFSEVNSMAVYKNYLYLGYDTDGFASSQVWRWDGNTMTQMGTIGTGTAFGGTAFLIEYKGNLYAGTQGAAGGNGDVYVSTDDGANWSKSLENTINQFAYSASVFKGKLFVGAGYGAGTIYSFDGTTWSTAYSGTANARLISDLKVYKGLLFASGAASSGGSSSILSSPDGTNWTSEVSVAIATVSQFNRFEEFNGKLYCGAIGTNAPLYVRDDATGTWSVAATFTGGQSWGLQEYNGNLYVGITTGGTAAGKVYKSPDGVNWTVDLDPYLGGSGGSSPAYEAFRMIKYNGSLYVGYGGNGRYSADLWRKTESLGELWNNDHKIVKKMRFNTGNGFNYSNDESSIAISSPVILDTNLGIGTSAVNSGKLIVSGGNVGIGSVTPGQVLDVQGTVRSTYFVGDGSGLTGIGGSISGLTTNQVSKATSSTTIGDSIITDNGTNVGISSTSPGEKLDVNGTVRATNFSGSAASLTSIPAGQISGVIPIANLATGTPDGTKFVRDDGTLATPSGGGGGVGVGTINPGVTNFFSKYVQSTTLDDSSILNEVNSNIGIGSATPGQTLDVQGTIRATNFNGITQTGTTANSLQGNLGLGTTFTTTARLTVMNGNVGIGTWKPVAGLHIKSGAGGAAIGTVGTAPATDGLLVIGNTSLGTTESGNVLTVVDQTQDDANFALSVKSNGTQTAQFISRRTASSSAGGGVQLGTLPGTAMTSGQRLGFLIFQGSEDVSNTAGNGASIQAFADGTWTTSSIPTYITLNTAPSGSTTRTENLRVTSGGNVGIGTTIPSSKLGIGGNQSIGAAYSTIAAPSNGMIVQGNTGLGVSAPVNLLDVNGGMVVGTAAGVTTAPSNGMFISGNVGIGSTVAASPLQVVGNGAFGLATLQNQSTSGWSSFDLRNSVGTQVGGFGYGNASAASFADKIYLYSNSKRIDFSTDNGTTAHLSINGGNIGISSAAPGAVLDVAGASRFQGVTSTNGIASSVSGGSGTHNSMTSNGLTSGSILSVSSTNSSSSLTGNAINAFLSGVNNAGTVLYVSQFGNGNAVRVDDVNGDASPFIIDSTGNVGIGTTTASGALIVASGNVGIGSLTPGTALDVTGTSRMTGFTLTGNGASAGNVLVTNAVGLGTWMAPASIGAGGGSGTINSGTTSRSARYSGATTLDSSTKVFDDGTNVGIGTIAPRSAVELGVQAVNIVGSNVGIGSISPGQLLDAQGTIRAINIITTGSGDSYTSGNLGIGTATPGQALDINGRGRMVGLGTTVPNPACIKADGTLGWYTGSWGGTCN